MATDTPIPTVPITVTSNLPKPATTTTTTAMSLNNTEYLVRFPPFPLIPEGVQIIPWKEFKERGIKVHPGNEDIEIDACGVPTIMLASVHVTDWCKTETKRAKTSGGKGGPGKKKRKRKGGVGMNAGPTAVDWEEYWEEREAAYRVQATYDPHLDAYERFCQGALDFKNLRPWPLAQKQSGPVYVWGEFLRFAGIPLNLDFGGAKAEESEKKQKAGDDSDSDYGEDEEDDSAAGILNPHNLVSMDVAMKAQAKGEAFLKDPALMLKVFLSSYARDRGIIWTDANLAGAPILMRFFVNFLIDNKVLPNREEKAIKHESTRRVLDLALKELPITSKLAKVWPDDFHKACKECWGSKAEVLVFRSVSPIEGAPEGGGGETATATNVDATNETSTLWESNGWADSTDATDATTNTETNGWDSGGWEGSTSWGAGTPTAWDSGVVTVDVDEEGEVETRIVEVTETADGDINIASDNADADADRWDTFQPASLLPLLGPTALPITHTTGIVESSVRRIKAVFPPSPDVSKFPIAKDVSAEAVEGVLKRTFGVVVFEPWVNWNKGEEAHLSMPKILESSRGAVKTDDTAAGVGTAAALPPFDPHKDDINVIINPAYIDLFSVGMGCLCTWVQMARVEDLEPQDPKKKKKKNAKMERFWYVEELLRVVPSYYTYLG